MAKATGWTAEQMPSQAGKTVLVTGANSGIGLRAAMELARHGAHVLLGVRGVIRGEAAREEIRMKVPGAKIDVTELDMASLTSIRKFASGFGSRGYVLDVLVNNAGVMALPKRQLTPDGFERQFGTNHLGHFALTGLLMPQLLAAKAPRVVTVASLAHRNGRMVWANLQSEGSYKPWDAYNTSKLANLLFSRELDRRAREAGSRLISVAVHPGVSQTNIKSNGPGNTDLKTTLIFRYAKFLTQSDEAGAWPTEYAATMPEVVGGEYIGPNGFGELKGHPTVVKPRANAENDADARRLWTESETLTRVEYPPLH